MNKVLVSIENALKEKQAEKVEVMNVAEVSPLADYLIIASASNSRKLNSLKDEVEKVLIGQKADIKKITGKADSGWIIIDAFDIIIHLFSSEERERIDLDTLLLEDFGAKRKRKSAKKELN